MDPNYKMLEDIKTCNGTVQHESYLEHASSYSQEKLHVKTCQESWRGIECNRAELELRTITHGTDENAKRIEVLSGVFTRKTAGGKVQRVYLDIPLSQIDELIAMRKARLEAETVKKETA